MKINFVIDNVTRILHVSDALTAKMQGVNAISTSALNNPLCIARMQKDNSICAKCFAASTLKRYKSTNENYINNMAVLADILPVEQIPVIFSPSGLFRFEAFGDLFCVNQVINYFNIARKNSHLRCALWTKNPQLILKAIEAGHAKPNNLKIVLSSEKMNQQRTAGKYSSFVDSIFTVYDSDTIKDKNININCGGRRCAECRRCYEFGKTADGPQIVNEKLK